MKVCTADDCSKKLKTTKLCAMHYARMNRHGSLEKPKRKSKSCEYDGCDKQHYGDKYCRYHGQKMNAKPYEFFVKKWSGKTAACKKCSEVKNVVSCFYYAPRSSGNPVFTCKDCVKERASEWGRANPEKRKEIRDKWNNTNPDYYFDYYQENVDDRKKYQKDYYENNKADRISKSVFYLRKRRAGVRSNSETATYSKQDMESYWIDNCIDMKCYICGGNFDHVDHVIPLSKGGVDDVYNLMPACKSCNLSKNATLLEEWLPRRLKRLGLNEPYAKEWIDGYMRLL